LPRLRFANRRYSVNSARNRRSSLEAARYRACASRSAATAAAPLLDRSSAFSCGFARNDGLRRCQSRDRHPIRGTAHIVESDLITELDRGRIAAVLAADSDFEVRPRGPALFEAHLDEDAHTIAIQLLERIGFQDPFRHVIHNDLAGIIAGETERRLSQVVRAK